MRRSGGWPTFTSTYASDRCLLPRCFAPRRPGRVLPNNLIFCRLISSVVSSFMLIPKNKITDRTVSRSLSRVNGSSMQQVQRFCFRQRKNTNHCSKNMTVNCNGVFPPLFLKSSEENDSLASCSQDPLAGTDVS